MDKRNFHATTHATDNEYMKFAFSDVPISPNESQRHDQRRGGGVCAVPCHSRERCATRQNVHATYVRRKPQFLVLVHAEKPAHRPFVSLEHPQGANDPYTEIYRCATDRWRFPTTTRPLSAYRGPLDRKRALTVAGTRLEKLLPYLKPPKLPTRTGERDRLWANYANYPSNRQVFSRIFPVLLVLPPRGRERKREEKHRSTRRCSKARYARG